MLIRKMKASVTLASALITSAGGDNKNKTPACIAPALVL